MTTIEWHREPLSKMAMTRNPGSTDIVSSSFSFGSFSYGKVIYYNRNEPNDFEKALKNTIDGCLNTLYSLQRGWDGEGEDPNKMVLYCGETVPKETYQMVERKII